MNLRGYIRKGPEMPTTKPEEKKAEPKAEPKSEPKKTNAVPLAVAVLATALSGTALYNSGQPQEKPEKPAVASHESESVDVSVGDLVRISPKTTGKVRYILTPKEGAKILPVGAAVDFAAQQPGEYTLSVLGVVDGEVAEPVEIKIHAIAKVVAPHAPPVAKVESKPIPKVEPPKPPAPKPVVVAPVKPFRVLIVYNDADAKDPGKSTVIFGKDARDWLEANCSKDGQNIDRRIYPCGVDVSDQPAWVKDAFTAHKGKDSWMVAGGYDGAIPANAMDAITVWQKTKGN